MEGLKRFLDKTKYTALFFLALVFNSVVLIGGGKLPTLFPVSYSMHLLDYGFGFCARFLPGQLYRWISGGNYAYEAVQTYDRVLVLIAFLLIALLLNRFVLSAPQESRKWYVLVSLFYSLGPLTFSVFTYGLGIIDTLWVLFTPLFLLLLGNKYLKYAAPLLIIPMMLVHFSAIICYCILIFFVLLYLASAQTEKKQRAIYGGLFAVCFVFAFSLALYFVLFESSNVKYSAEETMRRVMERSQIGKDTDLLYVNFDIFKIITFEHMTLFEGVTFPYDNLKDDVLIPAGSAVPSFIAKFINAVWPNVHFHFAYYTSKGRLPDELVNLVTETVFMLPVIAFIMAYFRHRMRVAKEAGNGFQRLLFLLAILYMPVALVYWFVFSIDLFRYFNHTLIVEGGFMLAVMYLNGEDTAAWLKEKFTAYDKRFLVLYAAVYFMIGSVVL